MMYKSPSCLVKEHRFFKLGKIELPASWAKRVLEKVKNSRTKQDSTKS